MPVFDHHQVRSVKPRMTFHAVTGRATGTCYDVVLEPELVDGPLAPVVYTLDYWRARRLDHAQQAHAPVTIHARDSRYGLEIVGVDVHETELEQR